MTGSVNGEYIPNGVHRLMVEETIASGIKLLKFPASLEAAFELETGPQRCRQLAIGAIFGMLLYDLFLITDWLITPDAPVPALQMSLAFVTLIGLLMALSFYHRPPVVARELLVTIGGGFLGTSTAIYLMMISKGPHYDLRHQGIIIIILFLTMVQRARFWYSLPTCIACFVIYAVALSTLPDYPFDLQVSANTVFGWAIALSLFASYVLERETRMNYLLSLRGRLQRRELDIMSHLDQLTGLRNRRSLERFVDTCERSTGPREELSVVLLDIDHFKKFNDAAGHPAGDVCLKRVAGIIQGELRDHADGAFRYGGEEFIIVLPGVDLLTAVKISERVRKAVEATGIPHPALEEGDVVTVSLGVASDRLNPEKHITEIIASADTALYAAKRNGRNQVWPRLPSALRAMILELPEHRGRVRVG